MTENTLKKLLQIVTTAITKGDTTMLYWLAEFFEKQAKTNEEIDNLLK